MSDDDGSELRSAQSDGSDEEQSVPHAASSSSAAAVASSRHTVTTHRHRERVFIFDGADAAHNETVFFALPHVRGNVNDNNNSNNNDNSRTGVRYAFCSQRVFELQACREAACSWLLDESVVRDGTLYIATPVDPLLLLIPRLASLRQDGSVFVESSAVFEWPEWPGVRYLSERYSGVPLPWHLVCDVKLAAHITAVRLSDAKLAAWLDAKVVAVADALKADAALSRFVPTRDSKVVAATFKASSADVAAAVSDVDYVRNAVAYVSEYLPLALADALADRFAVRVVAADMNPLSLAKRMALAPGKAVDDILAHVRKENEKKQKEAAAAAKKQLSFGQKQLAKVDKRGMKPMTAFFNVTKKSKTADE